MRDGLYVVYGQDSPNIEAPRHIRGKSAVRLVHRHRSSSSSRSQCSDNDESKDYHKVKDDNKGNAPVDESAISRRR